MICLFLGCSEKKGKYFEYTPYEFSDKIKIEYKLSKFDETKKLYVDELNDEKIDPNKTAFVIIDLWRLNFLDPIVTDYINPLIQEVDSLGMKVLYAPSGGPQHRKLTILKNGVHFYNMDMMDKFILDNEIENLIYIGFDTFYCVLDKPNGIYSYLSRNNYNVKMFVMQDGVRSYTDEMKTTAIELLKKNNVGVIKTDSFNLSVPYPQKTITDLFASTKKDVPPGKDFIILFKNGVLDSNFLEFEAIVERNTIDYAVVSGNQLYFKDEPVSFNNFMKLIHEIEVDNLYYAGYYLNNEILWSDYGLISMYIKKRYNAIKIPNLFFINDLCYIAPGQNIPSEVEKYTIINHYRGIDNILSSTLIKSFSEKSEQPTVSLLSKSGQ